MMLDCEILIEGVEPVPEVFDVVQLRDRCRNNNDGREDYVTVVDWSF